MIRTLALGTNWWLLQVGIPLVLTRDSRTWMWAALAAIALGVGAKLESSVLTHLAFPVITVAPLVRSPGLVDASVMPPLAFALATVALVLFLLLGNDAPIKRPRRRVLDAKWARRRRYFLLLSGATFMIPAALLSPFVIAAPASSARDTASVAMLAVLLVVVLREILLGAIEDHVAQDIGTRARIEAVRALDRVGQALPRALAWIAVAALAFAAKIIGGLR